MGNVGIMSSETYKLHSEARRYCIKQHGYWCDVYESISKKDEGIDSPEEYTDEDYNTFPRYHTLKAILNEVEKIDADNLPVFSELLKLLVEAGKNASDIFFDATGNDITERAITDEKEKFVKHIQNLSEESVGDREPLPYRRILSQEEITALWEKIDERWGTTGTEYWYPLIENKTESSLTAYDALSFHSKMSSDELQSIMGKWGVERLYELREYGDENYSLSIDLWDPRYNGAEGFWVSEDLDWILYASHENTITVGGRLTEEI
jgi:hypothetical protein